MILHSFVHLSYVTKSGLLRFTLFEAQTFCPTIVLYLRFLLLLEHPKEFSFLLLLSEFHYTTFPILLCLYVRYKLQDTSSQDAKMWLRVFSPFLQCLHLLSICLRIVGSLSLHFAVAFVTISCSSMANRYPSMCELRFDFRSQATDSD